MAIINRLVRGFSSLEFLQVPCNHVQVPTMLAPVLGGLTIARLQETLWPGASGLGQDDPHDGRQNPRDSH